jgi:hypothetical protein
LFHLKFGKASTCLPLVPTLGVLAHNLAKGVVIRVPLEGQKALTISCIH